MMSKENFEMNMRLANILGLHWHSSPKNNPTKSWVYSPNYETCDTLKSPAVELPDFCNSPNDAMPVIFDHSVSLVTSGNGMYHAEVLSDVEDTEDAGVFTCYSILSCQHENPLIAAITVILEVYNA